MTGDEFRARYGDIDDTVTTVQPGRRYHVRADGASGLRAAACRGVPPSADQLAGRGRMRATRRTDVWIARELRAVWTRVAGDRPARRARAARGNGIAVMRGSNHWRRQRRTSRSSGAAMPVPRSRALSTPTSVIPAIAHMSSRVRRPACWRSAPGQSSDSHAWRKFDSSLSRHHRRS